MARGISGSIVSLRGCAPLSRSERVKVASESGADSHSHSHSHSHLHSGKIRIWIVGATGFRQGLSKPTGLELLWQQMRTLSAPDVCVLTPMEWDADPKALAEYIARNSTYDARVFFYGYSYGVGHFGTRFWRALDDLGIGIPVLVSCDGIRRKRLLKPLSLRFFRNVVSIPVPGNVGIAYGFVQSNDRLLRGHALKADSAETQVHMIDQPGHDHYSIDESTSFHRVALTEARNLINANHPANRG
ncbi:MAG: hypothetical protein EA353_03755 [Puniceicoccaceae bacterium]|nr:MAG: hypothetical protein EA353_03755 [Puniceicoccaceae bacterium]